MVRIKGNRIAERRHQLKLSQEDLAELVKVSQIQISKYERGRNDPSADTLVALANALNTTTDWLLGETDHPEKGAYSSSDLDTDEKLVIQILRNTDTIMRKKIIDAVKALAG